jgi:glutathione synthase/RimK-type ligase-like ATP-grasp enzyme
MTPRVLLLGTTLNHEVTGLQEACRSLNLPFETRLFADLAFDSNKDLVQELSELETFDYIVSRVEGQFAIQMRTVLLTHSEIIKHRMLNGRSYIDFPILSKIQQYVLFARHGIPIPETTYRSTYKELPAFPVIMKGIFGSKGEAVHLVHDEARFRQLEKEYGPGSFVVQKPLPIGEDYRVLVLGDTVLGYMKKVAESGEFLTNIHAGGHPVAVESERVPVLEKWALAAAKVTECQFGGVDIMFDENGQPRVLEINRGAAYAGFEQLNPINVSVEIIKYLQSQKK